MRADDAVSAAACASSYRCSPASASPGCWHRTGAPAPVILDDALVYSDDDRIERMFDALHRQAREQQIIVFSCRQRAFAKLGGHVLRMTHWQPGGG